MINPIVLAEKLHPRKCTVFPFHPWDPKEDRKPGIVLWIPNSVEELIKTSGEKLQVSVSSATYILTEDGGKILDVDLINDGQKLYLSGEGESETHSG